MSPVPDYCGQSKRHAATTQGGPFTNTTQVRCCITTALHSPRGSPPNTRTTTSPDALWTSQQAPLRGGGEHPPAATHVRLGTHVRTQAAPADMPCCPHDASTGTDLLVGRCRLQPRNAASRGMASLAPRPSFRRPRPPPLPRPPPRRSRAAQRPRQHPAGCLLRAHGRLPLHHLRLKPHHHVLKRRRQRAAHAAACGDSAGAGRSWAGTGAQQAHAQLGGKVGACAADGCVVCSVLSVAVAITAARGLRQQRPA